MSQSFSPVFRLALLSVVLTAAIAAPAQTLTMGLELFKAGNVNPPGVVTILELTYPANLDGRATTATFGWSASPCPAAVKIKFFRPSFTPFLGGPVLPAFSFVTERGPFDVTSEAVSSSSGTLLATQTVALNPPVEVKTGDVIAITNLTPCGGPTRVDRFGAMPPPPGSSLTIPGDLTSSFAPSFQSRSDFIFLKASGVAGPALGLLNDRFLVTMTAIDPRTGTTADGVPNLMGASGRAGYFGLPAFTGDSSFPEVTVKMVDATGVPALGGGFWFFHAPLTDVRYLLTVKDQVTGAVKTFSNNSGGSTELCGGADTSAFPR